MVLRGARRHGVSFAVVCLMVRSWATGRDDTNRTYVSLSHPTLCFGGRI